MTNLQIGLDDALHSKAQLVASRYGLDLIEAIRLFLRQMVINDGLPFKPDDDPFFSPENLAAIDRSIAQINSGQYVSKSVEQLEAMEN